MSRGNAAIFFIYLQFVCQYVMLAAVAGGDGPATGVLPLLGDGGFREGTL
jgi:hypothetical protein